LRLPPASHLDVAASKWPEIQRRAGQDKLNRRVLTRYHNCIRPRLIPSTPEAQASTVILPLARRPQATTFSPMVISTQPCSIHFVASRTAAHAAGRSLGTAARLPLEHSL